MNSFEKARSIRTADELRQRVDMLGEFFETQRQYIMEVAEKLAELRVTAASSSDLASVTVDADGIVTEVTIMAHAMHYSRTRLEAAITEAARTAARIARKQAGSLVAELVDGKNMNPSTEGLGSMPGLSELHASFGRSEGDSRSARSIG